MDEVAWRRLGITIVVIIGILCIIGLLQQIGPHSSAGGTKNDNSAIVLRGDQLVLQTVDKFEMKYTFTREGNKAVMKGQIVTHQEQQLCGIGCKVTFRPYTFTWVEVEELPDGAMKVTWSPGLRWR